MGNLLSYRKLFSFSYVYIHRYSILNIKKDLTIFLKIIKFLNTLKTFGIFLPASFSVLNETFFSFWVPGCISNFGTYKWYLVDIVPLGFLPYILINLTPDINISLEIKNSQRPLLSIFNDNSNIYEDFFFQNNSFINYFSIHYDTVYFFLFMFNFLKAYRYK